MSFLASNCLVLHNYFFRGMKFGLERSIPVSYTHLTLPTSDLV